MPTLDSIASTRQVERKLLRNSLADLKSKLEDGSIASFNWLETSDMLADGLTKEVKNNDGLDDVLKDNVFQHSMTEYNKVSFKLKRIKIKNFKSFFMKRAN